MVFGFWWFCDDFLLSVSLAVDHNKVAKNGWKMVKNSLKSLRVKRGPCYFKHMQ